MDKSENTGELSDYIPQKVLTGNSQTPSDLTEYVPPPLFVPIQTGKLKLSAPGQDYNPTAGGCNWCVANASVENTGLCTSCIKIFERTLNSASWRRQSRKFLEGKFCKYCPKPATEVHHSKEWFFWPELFWDNTLWEEICNPCHRKITNEQVQARRKRGIFYY